MARPAVDRIVRRRNSGGVQSAHTPTLSIDRSAEPIAAGLACDNRRDHHRQTTEAATINTHNDHVRTVATRPVPPVSSGPNPADTNTGTASTSPDASNRPKALRRSFNPKPTTRPTTASEHHMPGRFAN